MTKSTSLSIIIYKWTKYSNQRIESLNTYKSKTDIQTHYKRLRLDLKIHRWKMRRMDNGISHKWKLKESQVEVLIQNRL